MTFTRQPLRRKVAIALVWLVVISTALFAVGGFVLQQSAYRRRAEAELDTIAGLVALGVNASVQFGEMAEAERILEQLRAGTGLREVHVFALPGHRPFASAPGGILVSDPSLLSRPGFHPVEDQGLWLVRELRDGLGRPFAMAALFSTLDRLHEERRRSIYLLAGVSGILIGLAWWAALLLSRQLTRPLQRLGDAVREIELRQDHTLRAPKLGRDEVGELAEGINHMLEALESGAKELRDSEERYRALIDEAQDAIFTLSVDGKVEAVNQAGNRITGWGRDLWVGKDFSALVHPEDLQLARDRFAAVIAGVRPSSFELRIRTPDGGYAVVEFAVSPRIVSGRVAGLLGIGRDVTERKAAAAAHQRLEAQLRQAQKMDAIGTLAGGIAHDFNNILTGIMGSTELAVMDLPPGSPANESLQQVMQASRRAQGLIAQIMTFSRREPQRRAPVRLGNVVIEVLKLLRPTLPAFIEIRPELAPSNPVVMAESTQVHQLLMNLATNAAHAMGTGAGVLTIREEVVEVDERLVGLHPALRRGSFVRLTVSDTGCGMDAATLERIFEPFFTTKAAGKGTGLGLAVVHGIMEAHEGAVVVRSTPGAGTAFELYFPASTEGAASSETTAVANIPAAHGERLMLVDDEESIAAVGRRLLERHGYAVESFADAQEALQAFNRAPEVYHLVITDLTMPRMKGTALAAEILRRRPGLPVLLMTGYSGGMDEAGVRALGLGEPLLKPFTSETLLQAVGKMLASHRSGA